MIVDGRPLSGVTTAQGSRKNDFTFQAPLHPA